jgi:hypothetical protein
VATSGSSSNGSSKKTTSKQSSTRKASARTESRPSARASQVAAMAAQELLALTGKEPEGIVGLQRDDDGWKVQIEVVEVRRIPDTTDVLALYEVTSDRHGDLQGYRRVKRYARGVPGDDT